MHYPRPPTRRSERLGTRPPTHNCLPDRISTPRRKFAFPEPPREPRSHEHARATTEAPRPRPRVTARSSLQRTDGGGVRPVDPAIHPLPQQAPPVIDGRG